MLEFKDKGPGGPAEGGGPLSKGDGAEGDDAHGDGPAWRRSRPGDQPWEPVGAEGGVPCVMFAETDRAPGRVTTPQGDVRFLNVSGSLQNMARELGRRTGSDAQRGAVPFFATYLERVLENSPVGRVAGALQWAAHRTITRRLRNNLPRDYARAIQAFAEGAGFDLDTVLDAYLMPETFLWIVGTFHRTLGTRAARGLGAPPMCGCTSAIARPPASDSLLHARNFDYFGIDYWDQYSTVVFYRPDDGLEYVSVSSAGFVGGGITAMNAAGLTLTVHQHFVDRFDLDGVPIGIAGDEVMRRAHTIEEAVAILRDYPPVAGWTYVLTEGDHGRAAAYEIAPGREHLHLLEDGRRAMGYANIYWGPGFTDTEVDYYPEYRRCNHARQKRVVEWLNERVAGSDAEGGAEGGALDAEAMARVLGDFQDPDTGKQRLFGPTIASGHTVASVVFEPARRRVWVGSGRSPTSRRWFIPFDLGRGAPDPTVAPFHPFPGWEDSLHGRAFDLYRHASHLFWEGESSERLLIMIEYALALYPEEPNLQILAGLLALRVQRGQRAEGAFRRALESLTAPCRRAEVGLYLAWALDLQGQRTAARHIYAKVAADPAAEPGTVMRARQGRWMRFGSAQAAKLPLDFTYASVP